MARMGMDVEAVEALAKAIQGDADRLSQLTANVDALVRKLPGLWQGPDATRFVEQWWPQHRKTLAAVQDSVRGLGQSALNNASEQRQASSANGGAGTGTTPPAPAAPPPAAQVSPPPAASGPGPYNAAIVAAAAAVPDGTHGGQCAIFAEDMIKRAGGPAISLGNDTSGYQAAWAGHSTEQTWDTAQRGDVVQWYNPANGAVHTAILSGGHSEQTATVIDSNYGRIRDQEEVHAGTFEERNNFGANNYKIWRVNT